MRQLTGLELGATGLISSQGVGLWLALAPSPSSILMNNVNDEDYRKALRSAEYTVAAVTLATGVMGSFLIKSPVPVITAMGIVGLLALAYEITLRVELVDDDEVHNKLSH